MMSPDEPRTSVRAALSRRALPRHAKATGTDLDKNRVTSVRASC